ncbi:MAG: helix-turn-helix transcriptional regulator [Lachnospiraceae bacterium]|nr:helix-turn-helix transcriptional regulator [Lachnospiraceae bacterium]
MTEKKVSTFQQRLCELIEESGKSQSSIASDFGIARQTISAWVTGQNSPRQPIINALAMYFGVTIPWLYGFDVSKRVEILSLSDDEKALIRAWRAADDRARSDALSTLLNHPA